MTKNWKIAVVVALVIAIIAIFTPTVAKTTLGNKTASFWDTADGYKVDGVTVINGSGQILIGTNGTTLNAIKTGACTIWAPAQTITATSTQQIVCQGATDGSIGAITGITADSICNVVMASSTNTTLGSLVVAGSSASSTAGTIVARLANFTGTTFTWSAAASSSAQWNYQCFDPA